MYRYKREAGREKEGGVWVVGGSEGEFKRKRGDLEARIGSDLL